jgi:hypothetical protein
VLVFSSLENKRIFQTVTMSSLLSSGLDTSDIVGIAVGGVLALVTIIGIAISCWAMCKKKNNPPKVGPYPPNYRQNPYGQPTNTGYYGQQPAWPPQPPNWDPRAADYPQQQSYPQQQPYPQQYDN